MDSTTPTLTFITHIAKNSAARFRVSRSAAESESESEKTNLSRQDSAHEQAEMIPTPSTSHVNYNRVYEPAEDSYLLLDTLSIPAESEWLKKRFPPSTPSPLALEVGTGSGVVLAFIAANAQSLLGRSDVATIGADINEFACKATADTVSLATKEAQTGVAGIFCDSVNADLVSFLKPSSVDILVFNPPYVPTESLPNETNLDDFADRDDFASDEAFERDSRLLALAYAGGIDGMETTNRLLDELPHVLSERGVAYILLCAQNRPEAVKERIRAWPGDWFAESVGSSGKKAGWERLSIVRIWRSEPGSSYTGLEQELESSHVVGS